MSFDSLFNAMYGPSWEEVNKWDDVVPLERKNFNNLIISNINNVRDKCPFLDFKDTCFIYCQARSRVLQVSGIFESTIKPNYNSAEYQSQIDPYSLQLWCLQPKKDYSNCTFYIENIKKEITL